MSPSQQNTDSFLLELRLFLEETCCNLLRFRASAALGIAHGDVAIHQESSLGVPGVFADIRVEIKGQTPYFIEVDYGYPPPRLVASIRRKYGPGTNLGGASKVIVVIDSKLLADWHDLGPQIKAVLQPGVDLEIWDEQTLLSMVRETFAVDIRSISGLDALELRTAINRVKGTVAFEDAWVDDDLHNKLIWHYGFWRLKQLRERHSLNAGAMFSSGLYKGVVSVMADLCGFSSYVRDTREDDIIRQCLTTFYSKARYAIINAGGMMYQFVGDEVIGLFGMPVQEAGHLEAAFECSRALADIGSSVSNEWQRLIDRKQSVRGVHIGIGMGDMQVVSLEPFTRSNISGIGEVINISSRLLSQAKSREIVASNTYYQALSPAYQALFQQCTPVKAKNMGVIQAWKACL